MEARWFLGLKGEQRSYAFILSASDTIDFIDTGICIIELEELSLVKQARDK